MSSLGDFMMFCAEQYKMTKHITGTQLVDLFRRYRAWEYIYSCYETLHTTRTNYIIEDIDLYIEARQSVENSILYLFHRLLTVSTWLTIMRL